MIYEKETKHLKLQLHSSKKVKHTLIWVSNSDNNKVIYSCFLIVICRRFHSLVMSIKHLHNKKYYRYGCEVPKYNLWGRNCYYIMLFSVNSVYGYTIHFHHDLYLVTNNFINSFSIVLGTSSTKLLL